MFIPSKIDGRRAVLGHTWLDNHLLLHIQTMRDMWANSEDNRLPTVLASIHEQLEKVRKLTDDATEGLSPAQLVDIGPLSSLNEEFRNLIKKAVHHAFLELGIVPPLVQEIRAAADDVDKIANQIRQDWQCGVETRSRLLDTLEAAGIRLRNSLRELPREVVFP
ncbi:MAG: hypothetical protein JWM21_3867 [Acidobacteria bacterium]|nr:hypothetical protein [Acidobacteriota bacterium]